MQAYSGQEAQLLLGWADHTVTDLEGHPRSIFFILSERVYAASY